MSSIVDGRKRILVSDFDGTMTRRDFYTLTIGTLLPPDTPDYWVQYRAGEITHFDALAGYFSHIRASEAETLAVVAKMELDPQLPSAVERLRAAGWRIVVTSAGCEWYIQHLLAAANVDVEVHANPGRFVEGRGLLMEMPRQSPYWSPMLGVDKAGYVRKCLEETSVVAYAGDGFPDADPARLVSDDLRFARSDLAEVLRAERRPYRSFERWSEIADALLERGA